MRIWKTLDILHNMRYINPIHKQNPSRYAFEERDRPASKFTDTKIRNLK